MRVSMRRRRCWWSQGRIRRSMFSHNPNPAQLTQPKLWSTLASDFGGSRFPIPLAGFARAMAYIPAHCPRNRAVGARRLVFRMWSCRRPRPRSRRPRSRRSPRPKPTTTSPSSPPAAPPLASSSSSASASLWRSCGGSAWRRRRSRRRRTGGACARGDAGEGRSGWSGKLAKSPRGSKTRPLAVLGFGPFNTKSRPPGSTWCFWHRCSSNSEVWESHSEPFLGGGTLADVSEPPQ